MEGMNFEGRYLTRNGVLVVVHFDVNGWRGHCIDKNSGKQQSFEYDPTRENNMLFSWDRGGNCIKITNSEGEVRLSDWDIFERISGKDIPIAKMKVEGCKECENAQ
jgi:hypothetical protein